MGAPYSSHQAKTERAFLAWLASAIAANVLTGFQSQEPGQNADDTENTRVLPCYVVKARDFEEYPKFTGNSRGNIDVTIMTSADKDGATDDPQANHDRNVGLVGDALAWDDLAGKLTTAARNAGIDFTCFSARYAGTVEQATKDRHFETVHVFKVFIAPSNVS
jgi:hypothetical protein